MGDLIHEIAGQLGQIDGVVAVVLGGSHARGLARPDSDIDLGIYYDPANAPSVETLRELAQKLDDRHLPDLATEYGAWGPWINGGGWLDIDGQRVDWLYRDLNRVEDEVTNCENGQVRVVYQWGHPHGFYNHIYLGELYYCKPLFERDDQLQKLKARVEKYPAGLKQAILSGGLAEAGFSLENAQKPAKRGDTVHVMGHLYRAAALLTQVLFALNERYCINEKGAVLEVDTFAIHPLDYANRMGRIFASGDDLPACVEQMAQMLQEVKDLCDSSTD